MNKVICDYCSKNDVCKYADNLKKTLDVMRIPDSELNDILFIGCLKFDRDKTQLFGNLSLFKPNVSNQNDSITSLLYGTSYMDDEDEE